MSFTWNFNPNPHCAHDAQDPWASPNPPHTSNRSLWQQPASMTQAKKSSSGVEIKYDSWSTEPQPRSLWQPPKSVEAVNKANDSWGPPRNEKAGTSWQAPPLNVFNGPVHFTSPSPMAYPTPIYQSSPSAPGPQDGNHAQGKDASGGVWAHGASRPVQFVHQTPTGNTTYYCKELNGNWSVRTTNDIMNNCQPGDWRSHSKTGFPYWVRKAAT